MSITYCADVTTTCGACNFGGAYTTLTPPFEVSPVPLNLTTVYPVVAVYPDNRTSTISTITSTDTAPAEYAEPTWMVSGVTLTAPTTYLQYTAFDGAAVPSASSLELAPHQIFGNTTCPPTSQITLPTNTNVASLIYALPTDYTGFVPLAYSLSVPSAVLQYLDSIPTVEQQMQGYALETCHPLATPSPLVCISGNPPSSTTTSTSSIPSYCPTPTATTTITVRVPETIITITVFLPSSLYQITTSGPSLTAASGASSSTTKGTSTAVSTVQKRDNAWQHGNLEMMPREGDRFARSVANNTSIVGSSITFPPGCSATSVITITSTIRGSSTISTITLLPGASSSAVYTTVSAITKSTMPSVNAGTAVGPDVTTRITSDHLTPLVNSAQFSPGLHTPSPDDTPSPVVPSPPDTSHNTVNSPTPSVNSPTPHPPAPSSPTPNGQPQTSVVGPSTSTYTYTAPVASIPVTTVVTVTSAVVFGGSTSTYTSNGQVYTTVSEGSTSVDTYLTTEEIVPTSTNNLGGYITGGMNPQPYTGAASKAGVSWVALSLGAVAILMLW